MPNNLNNDNTFSINDHSDSSFTNTNNHFNSNVFNSNDIINANPNNSSSSACLKETGIIEKMLVSYGFIQCCERQARLFFHFSQYLGNIDHLKIGDPVEYEMSYDRRTGKPVAINIRKITSDDLMTKLIKTERVSGVIATEIATNGREGRVAFENLGEFFFLPFSQVDVIENVILKAKDKVSFIIVTDDSGNYRAKDVQLESPNSVKIQGMISSIKDTFGFIDRSDNMANIFFHSSDCPNFKSLNVGDYVEFTITSRKNKELAINVCKAPTTADEISEKVFKGQIVKYNGRNNLASGIVKCPELNQELNFSDKNVKGNFTLYPNDFVTFQICTDRHSQSQRACNMNFIIDTFTLNSEPRERGYIASLKETYGFIKSPIREGSLIYFKLTEFIDPHITIKLNDEVEFTLIIDAQAKRSQALRISILPNGTIFNIFSKKLPESEKLNKNENNKFNIENNNYPLIDLNTEVNDTHVNSANSIRFNGNGDNLSSVWSMEKSSLDTSFSRNTTGADFTDTFSNGFDDINGEYYGSAVGIIVAIKESYCFIESIDGENEYFGHQSGYIDLDLEMGQTVEFVAAFLNGKWKATSIRKKNNVAKYEGELSDIYTGIVLRTIQMFNPDQTEYPGLIARSDHLQTLEININDAFKIDEKYEFSMTSFKFLKDYISAGDMVKFQVATSPVTKKRRAYNIEVLRERIKGTIYVISRMYGFVKADIENESKKIYFNKGEVSGSPRLKIGDPVDFYLVDNKKSEKQYAIDIVKLEDLSHSASEDRPLMFKNLALAKDKETGPKVIVIRQPRAPDGTKGFNTRTEENGQ